MPKKWVIVCVINFFIAALMGLVLRFSFIKSIPFNYRFLTHAHSHVAMLGWVYLMLFVLIMYYFIPNDKHPIFKRLFWVTQAAVVGMMLSFPFQGYSVVSITFSTLHILCSYYFVYLVWKYLSVISPVVKRLIKTALVFMLLSTVGVWCLGPAVSILGQASAFYQVAIQFFLHFQFNGWFLIAVLAIFFHLMPIAYSKTFKRFFYLLILSTVLTMALPIQWFAPHVSLIWINMFGIILQMSTLFLFFKLIQPKLSSFYKAQHILTRNLFKFAMFCFSLKIVLQLTALFPDFAQVVYEYRNFVIGFIHLTMLGVISGFLFAFILQTNQIQFSKILQLGIYLFVLGFILTELLIGVQGYCYYIGKGIINHYYLLLFLFSILLPLGIGILITNLKKNKI